MSDIVYFFVPENCWGHDDEMAQRYNLRLGSWTEISIMDSHSIYNNKNWIEKNDGRFFVNKSHKVFHLSGRIEL